MKLIFFLISILTLFRLPQMVWAQNHGTCSTPEAEAILDANNVRAKIFNHGGLFGRGSGFMYEVPKNAFPPKTAIQRSGIWLGGKVNGELRFSEGPYEMWPGPIPDDGSMPNRCEDFDHIYKISHSDIEDFHNNADSVSNDLLNWPYELGAGVIDGDGIEGNYDLHAGDRPRLLGDQSLWWITNDRGNEHVYSGADPLGVEVRTTAFAMQRFDHFNNTTVFELEIFNPNDYLIDSTYFGVKLLSTTGSTANQYLGSDSLLSLGYLWSGVDIEEREDGSNSRPPAIGIDILKGPIVDFDGVDNDNDGEIDEPGESLHATAVHSWGGDSTAQGRPIRAKDKYGYLRSLWRDGVPLTIGGTGRGFSNEPTKWYYPGDPPNYWTEDNIDNHGSRNHPGSRYLLVTSGPFRIEAKSSQTITFAVVWAQGENRFDSLRLLKEASAYVQSGIEAGVHFNKFDDEPPRQPLPERPAVRVPYPNPSTDEINLEFNLTLEEEVNISLYDVQGREVMSFIRAIYPPGFHKSTQSIESLNPGMYFIRYQLGRLSESFSIVKIAP